MHHSKRFWSCILFKYWIFPILIDSCVFRSDCSEKYKKSAHRLIYNWKRTSHFVIFESITLHSICKLFASWPNWYFRYKKHKFSQINMFICLAPTSYTPQASHPVQHRLRRPSRTLWAHDRRWEREHRPHWSETTITKIKIVIMVFLLRVHIFIWNADMLVQKGIRPKDALLVAIRQNLSNWKTQK